MRIYSQYFRRTELLIEYKNLRNPNHCPTGMYIMPDLDNLNEWHGVLFVHRGYYKEGIFKFYLQIPDGYPDEGPTVHFVTDMFHPLIDREGNFSLRQQFPVWRPQKDFLSHVLHYIKNSFREAFLANLDESLCPNREALKMFNLERHLFARLAAQCAQLSASDAILYDQDEQDGFLIKFKQLGDEELSNVKSQFLGSLRFDGTLLQPPTLGSNLAPAQNQKPETTTESELIRNIRTVSDGVSQMLYGKD
ncbi:ubiquitin-conjugating enzyme/RWD-like protein [Zopfochytrium polystomum]|nr:ubiquitin-conjugating enzyme/RWD-like protein [Zopfochytrium polystomum]